MPWCGFNTQMVAGLTQFAEGLFRATVQRAEEKKITVEEAFREEVDELGAFLEAMENTYEDLRGDESRARSEVMGEVSEWVASHDAIENTSS